jgi:DNA-binding beta-propeller fold protein YncE
MRNGLAFGLALQALALQALVLPSLALAQSSAPLELKGRIPLAKVDGRMDHVGVDIAGQRLFAAAFDNKTLEVIDLQAGKQVHTIANLDHPQQSYFDAPSNHLFVSSEGDGTVKVFDGTTFALVQTTQLGADADNMRFDARNKHLVVANGGEKFLNGQVARGQGLKDGALAILDTAGRKLGQIPTDGHPESLAVEKNGSRVFTNVPDKKEIVVGDLGNYNVLAHWALPGCENYPMAFDEDHHRIFVMCRASGTVVALDSDSGKQVAVLPLTGSGNSDDMFYDAAKARIYVLARIIQKDNPRAPGPGIIEVFQQRDADHYEKIDSLQSGFAAQTGLFVPEWSKLFVATRHQPGGASGEILVYETK